MKLGTKGNWTNSLNLQYFSIVFHSAVIEKVASWRTVQLAHSHGYSGSSAG